MHAMIVMACKHSSDSALYRCHSRFRPGIGCDEWRSYRCRYAIREDLASSQRFRCGERERRQYLHWSGDLGLSRRYRLRRIRRHWCCIYATERHAATANEWSRCGDCRRCGGYGWRCRCRSSTRCSASCGAGGSASCRSSVATTESADCQVEVDIRVVGQTGIGCAIVVATTKIHLLSISVV